jgi:phytoene dehydrogenase-like protein
MTRRHDAIVIGSGHNGLTCACYLAKAGMKVLVLEQAGSIGGMTSMAEVTLPGFHSDTHAFGCQLAGVSPVPRELDLERHGFALPLPGDRHDTRLSRRHCGERAPRSRAHLREHRTPLRHGSPRSPSRSD